MIKRSGEIIIGVFADSFNPLPEVGKICCGIYERTHEERYEATFLVLREATRDEWLCYRREHGLDVDRDYTRVDARFFAVTTD